MENTGQSSKSGTNDSKPLSTIGGSSAGESPSQPLTAAQIDMLNQTGELVNELTTKYEDLNQKVLKLEDKQDIYLEKMHEGKERVTETLAVFVALFTFISINFNFFSNRCLTPQVFIKLNLVLGGFLLLFVLLVKTKLSIKNFIDVIVLLIALASIVGGVILLNPSVYDECVLEEKSSKNPNTIPFVEQNFINSPQRTSR